MANCYFEHCSNTYIHVCIYILGIHFYGMIDTEDDCKMLQRDLPRYATILGTQVEYVL